jgi:hypothetical protein
VLRSDGDFDAEHRSAGEGGTAVHEWLLLRVDLHANEVLAADGHLRVSSTGNRHRPTERVGIDQAWDGNDRLGGEGGPDWNGDLKPGPLEIGFDHCHLLPTTNDRVPQVYVRDHRVLNLDPKDPLWVGNRKPSPDHPTGITHRDTLKMDWSHGHNQTIHNGIGRIGFYTGGHAARWRDEDLADEWVNRSIEWLEQNQDDPFFLFFSSHDLHVPRMPHERFQGKTKLGFRGDSIAQLDWCVGELVKTLDRLKLSEKTMIVFCSDNGPVLDDGYKDGAIQKNGKHKPAGPFRGGKYGRRSSRTGRGRSSPVSPTKSFARSTWQPARRLWPESLCQKTPALTALMFPERCSAATVRRAGTIWCSRTTAKVAITGCGLANGSCSGTIPNGHGTSKLKHSSRILRLPSIDCMT